MLKTITCVAAAFAATSLVADCSPLTPDEEKVVGIWSWDGPHGQTTNMVFKRDRSFAILLDEDDPQRPRLQPPVTGVWRVEGKDLVKVEKFHFGPPPGGTPFPKRERRLRIRELQRDKLVFEDTGPFVRIR